MRRKRRITNEYVKEIFKFDINKEKAMYSYLCGEKLNKKQKKLLNNENRFEKYKDWKEYQLSRYNMYSRDSLIEFKRILNLKLRNNRQDKNIYQVFCSAYLSAFLSKLLAGYLELSNENISTAIAGMFFVPLIIAMLMVMLYKNFWIEERYIPFFEDMLEIVDEIIEQR